MLYLATITAAALTSPGLPARVIAEQERVVRGVAVAAPPRIGSNFRDPLSVRSVEVPKELAAVYEQNPAGTLDVLLRVAAGANPVESITAVTYAAALLEPQGGGVVMVENFDRDRYDVPNKFRDATPRQHWIRVVKRSMRAKP